MSIGQCVMRAGPTPASGGRVNSGMLCTHTRLVEYVNYLGREADEGADRINSACGPEKYQRVMH